MKKKIIEKILAVVLILGVVIVMIISLSNRPIYKVTFADGDSLKVKNVLATETIEEPNKPIKEGYKFLGWYLNDTKYNFRSKITQDLELVAKWELKEVEKCCLSFDSMGGTEIEDIWVEKDKIVSVIPNPEKEGYTFIGWYYENKKYDFSKKINTDVLLVAKWKKNK